MPQFNFKLYLLLQMVNPVNFQFILLKTQGKGTENGPINILNQVTVGMTYTDSTNRLSITRISSKRVLVVFSSGFSFELVQEQFWVNALNVKVPQVYTAENKSRGMMGSTRFENCELFI